MRTKQFRVYGFNAMVGIAVVVALLLALQMSLAQAQEDVEQVEEISTYVSGGTPRDYSCTPGATGHCTVQFILIRAVPEALATCGEERCLMRLEVRW